MLFAGVAGLTWEILWIHYANLALGVSAQGAAITFSSVMLGMGAGSLLAGRLWSKWPRLNPLKIYALFELMIGLSGLWLAPGFRFLERIDASVFAASPPLAPVVHLVGIVLLLGIPSFAMGASMPAFAEYCARTKATLARVYAVQVAGASVGVLVVSLWVISSVGIHSTVLWTSVLNCAVALAAFALSGSASGARQQHPAEPPRLGPAHSTGTSAAALVAIATGFATFVLEVSWFRSLRAAFLATTESSAIVLSSALLGLALGAHLASWLRRRTSTTLAPVLLIAGLVVLLVSPVVERMDVFVPTGGTDRLDFAVRRLLAAAAVLSPPFALIGVGLPWLLDQETSARRIAFLYTVNTAGAVLGSVGAAWILLPSVGATRTGWMAGIAILVASAAVGSARLKKVAAFALVGGLAVAILTESGVGRERIQSYQEAGRKADIIEVREDPDSTVATVELDDGSRALYIDGFYATSTAHGSHYMSWMGRLPMLIHPDPKRALVICFGTGQTASAMRDENPVHLDIVDVSQAVLDMAGLYPENHAVLEDPRVEAHHMDGRAWLRRSQEKYDAVTLEPMPPTFAGSNALYSREFYELIRDASNTGGAVAQWLPFHLLTGEQSASIVATFLDVLHDVTLWVDPIGGTGILLGRTTATKSARPYWPGLARSAKRRNLSPDEIRQRLRYDTKVLEKYAERGRIITDDNQLLSFGLKRVRVFVPGRGTQITREELALLDKIAAKQRQHRIETLF